MALNIIKQVFARKQCLLMNRIPVSRCYSLFEPDYLQVGKRNVPYYPELYVQIKGYDYPILESYQAYIHKYIEIMGIDIDKCWPYPHQELKVQRYKPKSTVKATEYTLKLYERNIKISDVPATLCSLLIRVLEATLPEGVTLKVDFWDPELETKCYIPDTELLDLKSQLEGMQHKK